MAPVTHRYVCDDIAAIILVDGAYCEVLDFVDGWNDCGVEVAVKPRFEPDRVLD